MIGPIDVLLRTIGNVCAPGGAGARLSVAYFHRVLVQADPLQPGIPDARLFDAWMARCAAVFKVLPLDEAVHRLAAGTLPARSACITFDDGYRDNFEFALPILRRHGLTATFFIADGYLDGGRMFNDTVTEWVRRLPSGSVDLTWAGLGPRAVDGLASRRGLSHELMAQVKYACAEQRAVFCERLRASAAEPLPNDLMMSAEQVRGLSREGMLIGGHTVTHPILSKIAPEQARSEIRDNRSRLASLLGRAPQLFAYPNGKPSTDYRNVDVEAVRAAGYDAAFTTAYGAATAAHDPFQLPRLSPWDLSAVRFAARILGSARRPARVPQTAG